ncbi:gephyrin-like molybdotransferase receptor GlpR [Streptomyces sp. Amel2xB2]|uniref:divisome protein SepX/GlpR n=1 Tax=Streptomyces sp. Amel2xB2 TaxID=1305829 RepID=UPI0021ACA932|nr:gephyrin-like molybdotransferase receptor GlpR [Streptomyces sp. Amel2xB2]
MNSSGLIYAVIVGAWAAYLVPMWLRRQDELNESRPTERFSTAIRLLSGKAAMERRYARESERRDGEAPEEQGEFAAPDAAGRTSEHDDADGGVHAAGLSADDSVDVRAYADPKTMVGAENAGVPTEVLGAAGDSGAAGAADAQAAGDSGDLARDAHGQQPSERDDAERTASERSTAERDKARQKSKRAKVLARRRRTTMVLFLAFTAGTIVAAVGGLAFLWAPAGPGLLLSAYIVHLRVQERRRFAAAMDKRRTEAAPAAGEPPSADRGEDGADAGGGAGAGDAETEAYRGPLPGHVPARERPAGPARGEEPAAADRRALVEQTDHAEWVDQQRHGGREPADGWDPVPVPLPTYVSAPVAPRSTRGVDLDAPGTWSSARSSSAAGEPPAPSGSAPEEDEEPSSGTRRGRGRRQTPLFDQYEGEERPRAANE